MSRKARSRECVAVQRTCIVAQRIRVEVLPSLVECLTRRVGAHASGVCRVCVGGWRPSRSRAGFSRVAFFFQARSRCVRTERFCARSPCPRHASKRTRRKSRGQARFRPDLGRSVGRARQMGDDPHARVSARRLGIFAHHSTIASAQTLPRSLPSPKRFPFKIQDCRSTVPGTSTATRAADEDGTSRLRASSIL